MRREVGERKHGQKVDPGRRARLPVGAARPHGGTEGLREPEQSEVVDLHLGLRHVRAAARGDAVRAVMLGIVDQDVDLAADLGGKLLYRSLIGEVERQQRHLRQCGERIEARGTLPRLGLPDPHDVRTRIDQSTGKRLAHGGSTIGDQGLAKLRVAGHLAQLSVVGHVRHVLFRKPHQHRHPRLVEAGVHANARGRRRHVAMQMHHHRRSGIEPHHSETPRQPLAEEYVVAVGKPRLGDQLARARLPSPRQRGREAAHAGFARRILRGTADRADLQLEPTLGRPGREAKRNAAALPGRQHGEPRSQHRVLPRRSRDGLGHAAPPASTAAPLHSPRS